jgi:cephalosporin-C deacetylase
MTRFYLPIRRRLSAAALALVATFVSAVPRAHAQPLSFTPFHAGGIYELGERAGWTAALTQNGATPVTQYTYVIRKNNRDVVRTGTLDLSSGSGTIETAADEPAMLYVEVSPAASPEAAPGMGSAIHLGAAVAPWKLRPAVPKPADFDFFWDEKLKALSEIPVNPVLTPMETSQAGVELHTVKLDSLGSHVQGYLARPSREGKFPALVIFQYAGVYALRTQSVTDRAAEGWLAFDVDSHDMSPGQAAGVSTSYQAIGNTDREKSYFLNMYLRDARAIAYMESRPDWDGTTIVLTGTSMGGQQSLVAAGLRPEVTAVIVNEPSGADSNGDLHGHKAGYPNWPSNDPGIMRTALYFDTVNFASRIKAPVLAALGFIDTTAPPTGIWIALNQIPGPKEAVPMVESDHNNRTPQKQGDYTSRSRQVMELLLKGGEFKPEDGLWKRN